MTTFNDKEKAAENKYAHDKELEFKIHARANKLLGLWAAEKMSLPTAQAEEYAKSVVVADLEKPGHLDLFEKIKSDLVSKGIKITDHDIKEVIHEALLEARRQMS